MNRGQRLVLGTGVALAVLVGLFPPFAEVRTAGGVYSGSGPRGRGDERVTREFRGYDFVLAGREGTTMSGGLDRYAPDLGLLAVHWLVLLAGTGALWYALRHRPGESSEPGGPRPGETGAMNMADSGDGRDAGDPHGLNRFLRAQEADYEQALAEITRGRKVTHWMWYVFPQLDGLGFSSTAKHYAIKSLAEARAYLDHPVLGPRLLECAEAAVRVEGRSATEIFGSPDDLKLRSCATLFACVSPPGSVFDRLLAKYYGGARDDKTLRLLGRDADQTAK
jgi:uncharacterized protein (DUF1810 family)